MTNTSSIAVERAFACERKGRWVLYPVLTDNYFNEKDFGEIVKKKYNDSKPFSSFAAARTYSEGMDTEYAILFDTQTKFEPLTWYNIFHEVFSGKRFRIEADDMKNRPEPLPEQDIELFQRYAISLCHTAPSIYSGCYNESKQQMKETSVTSPWIAANALLGSKWLKTKSPPKSATTTNAGTDKGASTPPPPSDTPPTTTNQPPPSKLPSTNNPPPTTAPPANIPPPSTAPPTTTATTSKKPPVDPTKDPTSESTETPTHKEPNTTTAVGEPIVLFAAVRNDQMTYYETDFITPFKRESYLDDFKKTHGDVTAFTSFEELKDEAERFDEFMAKSFKTRKQFKAFDWYNIFHEAFHGNRLRTDRDDIPDRGTLDPVAMTDFTGYGYALCQTTPVIFGKCFNNSESRLEANFYTVQWLGAVALLGNTTKLLEEENPPAKGQPPEKQAPAPAPAPEQTEEEKQAHMNRLAIIRQSITRGFLARLKVQQMRREKAVSVMTSTIEIKSKADRLLASFETDTEFAKSMNAVELWALVLKQDALSLVIPSNQEEREKWDWKGECPKVPEMLRGHTELLRELWECRDLASCLGDKDLIEAARSAPRCQWKHFLVLLNRGRQIYSDFSFLNPAMSSETIKNLVFVTLRHTVKGPELQKAIDDYKARLVKARRTADSYKKKKDAQAEAHATKEEEEKIKAQKAELEKELTRLNKQEAALEEAQAGGTKRTAANATMAKRRVLRRRTPQQSKVEAELKKLEQKQKQVNEKKRKKETEAAGADKAAEEAKQAAAELQESLTNAGTAQPPAKKRAKKDTSSICLLDLTGDDCAAPKRTAAKNRSVYAPPGAKWHHVACHQHTVWDHCRGVVKEAALTGKLNVDYESLREADKEALTKKKEHDAEEAFKKVEQMKKQGHFTARDMQQILAKYTSHEEIYITSFVKRSIFRLGMLDVTEFGQESFAKIKPSHISNSLKTWLIDYTERKQFYTFLRVIEQLMQTKQIPVLKKLLEKNFRAQERAEMIDMLSIVAKKPSKTKK